MCVVTILLEQGLLDGGEVGQGNIDIGKCIE